MAIWYQCSDGEELDAICAAYYGHARGTVEQVLAHDSNRELAQKLPILSIGDSVYLPDITPDAPKQSANIWS